MPLHLTISMMLKAFGVLKNKSFVPLIIYEISFWRPHWILAMVLWTLICHFKNSGLTSRRGCIYIEGFCLNVSFSWKLSTIFFGWFLKEDLEDWEVLLPKWRIGNWFHDANKTTRFGVLEILRKFTKFVYLNVWHIRSDRTQFLSTKTIWAVLLLQRMERIESFLVLAVQDKPGMWFLQDGPMATIQLLRHMF